MTELITILNILVILGMVVTAILAVHLENLLSAVIALAVTGGFAAVIAVILQVLILVLLCIVLTLVTISFVHAVTARLKIEQLFKYYWTVVTGLALISLVLAWYGF